MKLADLKGRIPEKIYERLDIENLRPAQEKAVNSGLLEKDNLLVCTPTASGKTLIAELAACSSIMGGRGKTIYITPLKALATEKFREFSKKYDGLFNIALAIGDLDSPDYYLANYDLIICTSEKLDSLIRHHSPWLNNVAVLVIDEIHLLNDAGRGPTLEVLITILRQLKKDMQIIGLSATIGNEKELASWLGAKLVHDTWRPVELHKGTYFSGLEFENKNLK